LGNTASKIKAWLKNPLEMVKNQPDLNARDLDHAFLGGELQVSGPSDLKGSEAHARQLRSISLVAANLTKL